MNMYQASCTSIAGRWRSETRRSAPSRPGPLGSAVAVWRAKVPLSAPVRGALSAVVRKLLRIGRGGEWDVAWDKLQSCGSE